MAAKHNTHAMLTRRSPVSLEITNPTGLPVTLFANEEVPIERAGLLQLLEFLSLQEDLERIQGAQTEGKIKPYWGESGGRLRQVVLTPDFHKSASIPVGTVAHTEGFVIPGAVGNDIGCGMRLLITELTREDVQAHLDSFETFSRESFFEGKRNIPMSPRQRTALLRDGLRGLLETHEDNASRGIWRHYDPAQQEAELAHVHLQGSLATTGTFAFEDYIQASGRTDSYDSQIGSIGGGNHFVELQVVEELLDAATAHAWGLRPEQVAIMIHTGSVGLGRFVGFHFREQAHKLFPAGLPRPRHSFGILPTTGPHAQHAEAYLDAMRNAANFAFANRLMLGMMAVRALEQACRKKAHASLLYDLPHNLIWTLPEEQGFLHRKGACPAYGLDLDAPGPQRYYGQPVLIPGSMGTSSYIMAGQGNADALWSASHGAGRSIPRGRTRRKKHNPSNLNKLRVIMPVNPNKPQLRSRPDILAKVQARLLEEAPDAYKPITPITQTIHDANIARSIARLWPLATIKG